MYRTAPSVEGRRCCCIDAVVSLRAAVADKGTDTDNDDDPPKPRAKQLERPEATQLAKDFVKSW